MAGFINELQESLSDEAFQRFKAELGIYKKVSLTKDIELTCVTACSCCVMFLLHRNKISTNLLKVLKKFLIDHLFIISLKVAAIVCVCVVLIYAHAYFTGMYRFVLVEHRNTYDLFYREHTGKLLDKSKIVLGMYNCKQHGKHFTVEVKVYTYTHTRN